MTYTDIDQHHRDILYKIFVDAMCDLQQHKVKFSLHNVETVWLGPGKDDTSMGYWDDTECRHPELVCSVGGDPDHWLRIFAHEYCHFKQWKDRCDVWRKCRRFTGDDDTATFTNQYIHPRRMKSFLNAHRDLELDCEKRVVKMFKEYGAKPDFITDYIMLSNAYVYFYTYAKWYRQWCHISPSVIPGIIAACPDTFNNDYNVIPKPLLKQYIKAYPPKYEVIQ